jgi:hypothetical protein
MERCGCGIWMREFQANGKVWVWNMDERDRKRDIQTKKERERCGRRYYRSGQQHCSVDLLDEHH